MDIDAVFAEYHASLLRYLVRYTGDPDLAEDLVQETFGRLVDRPPERADRVRSWIFRVGTNLAREAMRTTKRRSHLLSRWQESVPGPSATARPGDELERTEVRRAVRAALDALSPRDRTVLLMREEGFTHREIAEAVGTTTNAVGVLIARGLDKLARRLAPSRKVLR